MIDITLLRIAKYQKEFKKIVHSIPMVALDTKTQMLLGDFKKYFKKFPQHEKIDLQVFLPRFQQWHSDMSEETRNAYIAVIRQFAKDVDEETRQGILSELYELDFATKTANMIQLYNAGELASPLYEGMSQALDEFKINVGAASVDYDQTDIGDLLKADMDDSGIKWRLECLNDSMRPLRHGDFGIIAARPDQGKTTFCADQVTYFAPQLEPDRNIVWLCNEGLTSIIHKRVWQSALGMTIPEMLALNNKKKLKGMYRDIVTRLDKIRIFDVHEMNVTQVEAILENNNPEIIIYDMIDKIRGYEGEARTDLQLEMMYDWARSQQVKYDSIGLATSQISVDGEGKQFPTMDMLKDSKTGKQGACDFILMIGASNDPMLRGSRFIGLPKNKLRRAGHKANPRAEVIFEPEKGRFVDIGLTIDEEKELE